MTFIIIKKIVQSLVLVSVFVLSVPGLFSMEEQRAVVPKIDRAYFGYDERTPVQIYCKALQGFAQVLYHEEQIVPNFQEAIRPIFIISNNKRDGFLYDTPEKIASYLMNRKKAIREFLKDITSATTSQNQELKRAGNMALDFFCSGREGEDISISAQILTDYILFLRRIYQQDLHSYFTSINSVICQRQVLLFDIIQSFEDYAAMSFQKLSFPHPEMEQHYKQLSRSMPGKGVDDIREYCLENFQSLYEKTMQSASCRRAFYAATVKELQPTVLAAYRQTKSKEFFEYQKYTDQKMDEEKLPATLIPDKPVSGTEFSKTEEQDGQPVKATPKKKSGGKKTKKKNKQSKKKPAKQKLRISQQPNNSNDNDAQDVREEENGKQEAIDEACVSKEESDRVVETCPEFTTVYDSKNQITLCAYSSSDSKRATLTHFEYKPNVQIWFEDPQQALQNQSYLDPHNSKSKHHRGGEDRVIQVHNFTKKLDELISQKGIQTKVASRLHPDQQDICITIPGHVEFETGKRETCLFVWLIDSKTKQCYHRNIEFRTGKQLVEDYLQNGFYQVEFPALC